MKYTFGMVNWNDMWTPQIDPGSDAMQRYWMVLVGEKTMGHVLPNMTYGLVSSLTEIGNANRETTRELRISRTESSKIRGDDIETLLGF
jgi:hypothetical protein